MKAMVKPGTQPGALRRRPYLGGSRHASSRIRTAKDDKFVAALEIYVLRLNKGFGEDKLLNYLGHQEIELALMRLYDITGDRSLVDLTRFFIEEGGWTDAPRKGHAWDTAAVKRGDDPETFFPYYWPRPRCY
ncbi:hypothetical protein LTR96_010988 [Exophiala xenobiotica]|nr:hypothetical protein LTR41_011107 [Exophiala xenobiotica]KAK5215894.1 hypothetical protein LTR72_011066 [Exophiala xenobiotica]KAK5219344.1 hypothetical protein LTR47_011521 [Exophiala xenobiotica]KAK5245934.1 hypothetical protein LTS06_008716 [Exophiala xenobiotica]KAK5263608.1 hypothetical protein LTR96_010988 [Exophiala xenobiotica]